MMWLVLSSAFAADLAFDEAELTAFRALSARDARGPSCAEIEAMLPTPVASLRKFTQVELPPMVPMRAATCLLENHVADEAVRAQVVGWMAAEDKAGFARLALRRLDRLPVTASVEIARAALAGPHRDLAVGRIGKTQRPEVRALLTSE